MLVTWGRNDWGCNIGSSRRKLIVSLRAVFGVLGTLQLEASEIHVSMHEKMVRAILISRDSHRDFMKTMSIIVQPNKWPQMLVQ